MQKYIEINNDQSKFKKNGIYLIITLPPDGPFSNMN